MKRLFALILCLIFSLSLAIPTYATEVDVNAPQSTAVQPRLRGTVTLSLGNAWTTFATDNNWFEATVTIINDASNVYAILVRVVDEDGLIIVGPQRIEAGESGQLGPIDAYSGKYKLQAKSTADSPSGFTLSYND